MKQEDGQIVIDLIPFVAKSIAQNPAARRELDCIYANSRIPIARAFSPKTAGYNCYYRECDVLTEIYCQKATDLVMTALDGKESGKPALTALKLLLKKCWRQLYCYVEASGPAVPLAALWKKMMKKGRKPTECELRNLSKLPPGVSPKDITTSNALDGDFPMFWFLVNLCGKTITEQDENFCKYVMVYRDEQERMHRKLNKKPPVLSKLQKELSTALWQYIEQQLKGIPASLDEYFWTQEYQQKSPVLPFKQEIFGDLPISAIKHVIISRQELRTAIDWLAVSLPEEATVTAELKQAALEYFRQVLFTRACAYQYERLRNFALEQSRLASKALSRPLQVTRLKEELVQAGQKKRELEMLLAQAQKAPSLEALLAEKQKKLNALQLKLEKSASAALSEITRLQQKLDAEREANQVLIRLLMAKKQQSEYAIDLSPDILEKIMLLSVVILGGRMDWQQRLKAKYPNFSLISSEDVKFDLSVLAAADIIVINWKYLGHSLFYRTINYAGKYNKPIVYLDNSNEKHLLQVLYRKCILPKEARG